jgi:hypothetical protein
MANPFAPKQSPFPHESKSETVKDNEVKELEEMEKLEPPPEPEYMKILREHGGLESNIGINHPYWKLRP